jgi:hypothetical protein
VESESRENRQSWILIAIAALSLVLGAIALVVAFDAKDSSEESASQGSVQAVDAKLSRLIDRLGIAEQSLGGEQKALQGKANRAERESRSAATTLSKRIARLERQVEALEKGRRDDAALGRRVGSLESQVEAIDARVASLSRRVTKLSRRADADGGTGSSGGQSDP